MNVTPITEAAFQIRSVSIHRGPSSAVNVSKASWATKKLAVPIDLESVRTVPSATKMPNAFCRQDSNTTFANVKSGGLVQVKFVDPTMIWTLGPTKIFPVKRKNVGWTIVPRHLTPDKKMQMVMALAMLATMMRTMTVFQIRPITVRWWPILTNLTPRRMVTISEETLVITAPTCPTLTKKTPMEMVKGISAIQTWTMMAY